MLKTASASGGLVQFGVFEVNFRSGELRKGGARVALQEQPLEVLKALLERPGELVTREELRQRLWRDDTFVDFDHGLNAAVKRLREALGDSADTPRFIETLPRRGYRFIAPVADSPLSTEDSPQRDTSLPDRVHAGDQRARRRRVPWALGALILAAALSAAGWFVIGHTAKGSTTPVIPVALQPTRVTFGPGLQTDPAWSPDGRSIAYASDKAGHFDIYVQPVSGGEPTQITRSPAQDVEPDWSPDGETLVFQRSGEDERGGIFSVPASGGPERQIASFGSEPKWSPDGSQVLFASSQYQANQAGPKLFVVRLNGGAARQILPTVLDGSFNIGSFVWHPDGRRISILGSPPGAQWFDLYTFALTGEPPVVSRIMEAKGLPHAPDFISDLVWDRSGTVLYARILSDVWAISIDARRLQAIAAQRLTSGAGFRVAPALSRGGERLAFTTIVGSTRLWSLPLDDSHIRISGPGEPVTPAGVNVLISDLASDGHTLAYISDAPDGQQVWVTDLVTGATKMLAPGQQSSRMSVQWSRDGSRLAYLWWRLKDKSGETADTSIVFQGRDGNEQFLTTPSVVGLAAKFAMPTDWSPNGDAVLASSDLLTPAFSIGLWPLAKAPRAERAVTTLSSDPGYNLWQGNYSPNGRWIAFVVQKQKEAGFARIAVMPSSGGDATHWQVLTDPRFWADKPRWSPDGQWLYYVKIERDLLDVWAQRFDSATGVASGAPVRVTHFNTPGRQIAPVFGRIEPSVSSSRLVLPIMENTGNIWVADLARR